MKTASRIAFRFVGTAILMLVTLGWRRWSSRSRETNQTETLKGWESTLCGIYRWVFSVGKWIEHERMRALWTYDHRLWRITVHRRTVWSENRRSLYWRTGLSSNPTEATYNKLDVESGCIWRSGVLSSLIWSNWMAYSVRETAHQSQLEGLRVNIGCAGCLLTARLVWSRLTQLFSRSFWPISGWHWSVILKEWQKFFNGNTVLA